MTTCGHAFCRDCIVCWFQQEKTCPVCRKTVHKLCKPPVIVSNLLSRQRLVCAFKDRGCLEVLPLDQMERHESVCRFRTRHGFFRSFIRSVLPSFLSLVGSGCSIGRVHADYDGEDADDEFEMQARERQVDVVPPFPLIFAFTAAGILYKSIYVFFNN